MQHLLARVENLEGHDFPAAHLIHTLHLIQTLVKAWSWLSRIADVAVQIKALHNAMHKDMTDLASMAQQQAARASDAEKRLVRSVSSGVQILQRKERAKLLQSLFIAWRCVQLPSTPGIAC